MALSHNFLPQTSLVFGVRDFAPQIENLQKADTQGLQNAFKFGTQVYDYMQSRKQANLMEEDTKNRKALEDSIAADTQQLEELKQQLAALKGGV
jgi:septal ring factor EnvC (AmiA/AmiB activator)